MNHDDVVFTIVTPSLNQGKFIEDCVKSVLAQGIAPFEHIVMDGGSTDNTLDILQKHEHLVWKSGPDGGQSEAINNAIKRARGDWIVWLNADDYLLPGALDAAMRRIQDGSRADILYGYWYLVDGEGRFKKSVRVPKMKHHLKRYWYSCPSVGTCFHRRVFFDYGLWLDHSLRIQMDVDLFARTDRHKCKFENLNRFMVAFRDHEENASLKRFYMSNEQAEMRWAKHLRERQRVQAKVILPKIASIRTRTMVWRVGNKLLQQHHRIKKTMRGMYLLEAWDRMRLKGKTIKF